MKQRLYRRLMIQLSDVPWMSVVWALGLVAEGAAWALGLTSFTPAWTFWLKLAVIYSALGYASFRLNRSLLGFLTGGAIAVIWDVVNTQLAPMQSYGVSGIVPRLALVAWCAVLPALGDRILDPWLMRGLFRRLASHHPRYHHLRS